MRKKDDEGFGRRFNAFLRIIWKKQRKEKSDAMNWKCRRS